MHLFFSTAIDWVPKSENINTAAAIACVFPVLSVGADCYNYQGADPSNIPLPCTKIQNFTYMPDGTIRNNAENLCLTGACSDPTGCYPLPLVKCTGADDQVYNYNSSSMAFISKATGKCLDVYADIGPNIGQWTCSGSEQQQWKIGNQVLGRVGGMNMVLIRMR